MTSLRDLCQAVVDADCPKHAGGTRRRRLAATEQALYAVTCSADVARTILAAITEAEERAYARAMGEVEAEGLRRGEAADREGRGGVMSYRLMADWARERAKDPS